MATVNVTPKAAKNGKATKGAKSAASAKTEKITSAAQPKEVAYNGFCIARSFFTKLIEAQASLDTAKANDRDGHFRWSIYTISAGRKDQVFPEGTQGSDKAGYAVAIGFDRSAVKAAAMLKEAQKHGKFTALQVIATKDHAKGTKQAKLAAKE